MTGLSVPAVLMLATIMAPGLSADPVATVYEGPNGRRCYIFWNDVEPAEYWTETNGVTTGGVPQGNPATGSTGQGSGLQRVSSPAWGNKDTKLTETAWANACNA